MNFKRIEGVLYLVHEDIMVGIQEDELTQLRQLEPNQRLGFFRNTIWPRLAEEQRNTARGILRSCESDWREMRDV